MSKKVADLVVDRLVDWGVDTIFGFPGDGVDGIFEALRTHQEKIKFIQVRHEEAAAFAACGYAKFTGRLGVCMATSGPGGVHLLNGLYDAKCDGQPVLAITGHTFHDLIGTYYQQDVDLDKLYMDVAAYNQRIMGPAHVNNVVDEAVKTALDRQTSPTSRSPRTSRSGARRTSSILKPTCATTVALSSSSHPHPPKQQLQEAAEILNQGEKVAILAGRGCLGAREEVEKLPESRWWPSHQGLAGQGRDARRQPLHHGWHRTAGHGALARRHAGMRHPDRGGDQLPLHRILSEAGPSQSACRSTRPHAHRIAPSGRRGTGGRLRASFRHFCLC